MTNYNFYTERKWGKASNYTLCLNSSQIGYDRCEKIIMECKKAIAQEHNSSSVGDYLN